MDAQAVKAVRGGGSNNIGVVGYGLVGHTAVALGIARRALQEIAEIANERRRPHYPSTLAEHPVFRHEYAVQDASFEAVRAHAYQLYFEAHAVAMSGREISPLLWAKLRQNMIYAHNVATEVIRFCYIQASTNSLRNPSVLGRCMRDILVSDQHLLVDMTHMVETAGPLLEERRAELAAGRGVSLSPMPVTSR